MYKRIYEDKEKFKKLGLNQRFLLSQSQQYLSPYLAALRVRLDARLVRTFSDAFLGIIAHRNSDKCLVLSELGGYIKGLLHAASGTKRLSNLFRSEKWHSTDLERVHLEHAKEQVTQWTDEGHRVLGFIDHSVVEKPESWLSEGLCAVHSSRAQRLTRIKRGYYRPPMKRLCVPGFEWTGLTLGGLALIPMLGMMKFWTKRGIHTDNQDNVFYTLLKQIYATFGSTLTLILDRGFANEPTLRRLFKWEQFFIIRWKSANLLQDTEGEVKNTWRICHGKKGMHRKVFWDKERQQAFKVEIIYTPVWHPQYLDKNLTLIVVRHKSIKGQPPMYLITNSEVDSVGIAWEILRAYMQRWDIEQAFRFNKTELGIQAIRVQKLETRRKIMALVMLIYDFMLRLWRNQTTIALLIMKKWCPRTDKRLDKNRLPLYRLRIALANILLLIVVNGEKS